MLSIFKKKQLSGNQVNFKIEGMHCTSCVMNIDGTLEDLDGVINSSTSYKKGQTTVNYEPNQINEEEIMSAIKNAGYSSKKIDR